MSNENVYSPADRDGQSGTDGDNGVPADATVMIRFLELPLSALFAKLPEELRGELWQSDAPPEGTFKVREPDLLRQMATGKILFPLEALLRYIPAGWIRNEPSEMVELDLPQVIAALPQEALQLQSEISEDMIEASAMPDYFKPAAEPAPAPVEAAETAAAPPPPQIQVAAREPNLPRVHEDLSVPCSALLSVLPEELRGASWQDGAYPDAMLQLDRAELLECLQIGKVVFRLGDLARDVPQGWVKGDPDVLVELNLAQVVGAVPADLLMPTGEVTDEITEAAQMPDYFKAASGEIEAVATPEPAEVVEAVVPAEPEVAEVEEPVPVEPVPVQVAAPEPETAAEALPPIRKTRAPARTGWEGVTTSLEFAARGIDINSAPAEKLTTLHGVGKTRAREIVRFREQFGRFESVFELRQVPGIGPHVFKAMTGISYSAKANPYENLLTQLKPARGKQPLLVRVVNGLTKELSLSGCLVTTREGLPLAASGHLAEEQSSRYAALGAHLFFRTGRLIQRLGGDDSDCMVLPGSNPPLLMVCADDVVLMMSLEHGSVPMRLLTKARRVAQQLAWLLGTRAVVLAE